MIVLSCIVIPCFLGIRYIGYERFRPYQEQGIETTGSFSGKESTYLPYVPSTHVAHVSFSVGDILDGTFQIYLTEAEHANPGYLKTLNKHDKVQLIYLEDNPKENVILKDSLDGYLQAQEHWFNKYYVVEMAFGTLGLYGWLQKRRQDALATT